jgi:hypothetical protein
MRNRKWLEDKTTQASFHVGPFLSCKTPCASSCSVLAIKCLACLCAKASVCSLTASPTCPQLCDQHFQDELYGTKQKILKCGHLLPGDCLSVDQYVSAIRGRLPFTFGCKHQGYTCGTLFVDHASGKIFNFFQLSNNAAKTITSKSCLGALANGKTINIKSFHTDNGIFASSAFKEDYTSKKQKLTFSGVGAHHQNGVVERNIKTISQCACASMLQAAHSLPEHANICLWPQAVDYAVWVFNHLPSIKNGVSPNGMWSCTISTVHMSLAGPFASLINNYKMVTKYPNGNFVHALDCLLVSCHYIHPWFRWC